MVNMVYPGMLHNSHNDFFSLAAEKLNFDADMLSQYQLELGNQTNHIPKFLETLRLKQILVCHYSVLKFYCKQGWTSSNKTT